MPQLIWSETGPFRLAAVGCQEVDTDEKKAACFLMFHRELFGILDPEVDLAPIDELQMPDGRVKIRYGQQLAGLPVFGAELVISLTADRTGVDYVASSHVAGVLPAADKLPPSPPPETIPKDWALELLSGGPS